MRESKSYVASFTLFADQIERYIRRAVWTLLALLLLAQLLLQIPSIRHMAVRLEKYEGVPFPVYAEREAQPDSA